VLWLLIVIVIVVKDKMYRKPSDNDRSGQ
jgi:hypothetical protein